MAALTAQAVRRCAPAVPAATLLQLAWEPRPNIFGPAPTKHPGCVPVEPARRIRCPLQRCTASHGSALDGMTVAHPHRRMSPRPPLRQQQFTPRAAQVPCARYPRPEPLGRRHHRAGLSIAVASNLPPPHHHGVRLSAQGCVYGCHGTTPPRSTIASATPVHPLPPVFARIRESRRDEHRCAAPPAIVQR